jgi:hypothetical protein
MAVVLVAGWMGGSWMLAVGLDNSCGDGAATGWMQKNQKGSWLGEVKIVVRSKLWHQMDETKFESGWLHWMDAEKLDTKVSYLNDLFLPDGRWRAPKCVSKLDQCASTRWLLDSAKALSETGPMRFYPKVVGFTGWMRKNRIRKCLAVMPCFYGMADRERRSAFRNWINAAFIRWLLERAKALFETASMRFYPMAAGERRSACENGSMMSFYRMDAGEQQNPCENGSMPLLPDGR